MNAEIGGNTRSTCVHARTCDPLGESLTQASMVDLGPSYTPLTSELGLKDDGLAPDSESEQMSITSEFVIFCRLRGVDGGDEPWDRRVAGIGSFKKLE